MTFSIISNDSNAQALNILNEYKSIFKHYDLKPQSKHIHHRNKKHAYERTNDKNKDKMYRNETKRQYLERNESSKEKKSTKKSSPNKLKQVPSRTTPSKSKMNKTSEKKVHFQKEKHNNIEFINVFLCRKRKKLEKVLFNLHYPTQLKLEKLTIGNLSSM